MAPWILRVVFALTVWAMTSGSSLADDIDLSKGYVRGDWALSLDLKWERTDEREEAILTITIQNLSDKAQFLGERILLVDYHIHIFDHTGREVPYNAKGTKEAAYPYGWKVLMRTLPPHGKRTYQANLSQYFDLRRGLPYTVKVRRYLTLHEITRDELMPPDEGIRLEYIDAPPIRLNWKN